MKLTTPNWKFSIRSAKYLFWLAPVLIVAGLTAGAVAGWDAVPLALIAVGLVILAAWLIFLGSTNPTFWARRSTQAGTNALIATLSMLAILGFVNFLAARYSKPIDLTENQILTLAPQSQEVVRNLDQPVKAWVFLPELDPTDQRLLENYRRENQQFSFEAIDPQAKPGFAREFGAQSIGEVYLEAGETRRLVQSVAGERLSERRLTNALAQLSNTETQKVYFLQGHGERTLQAGQGGLSQLTTRLNEERFTAEPLNLAENPKIPADAAAVVIAGAQRPLLASEITALEDYQKRKSGVMLLIDPQTDPKLDRLLQAWGVTVSNRLVTDPAGESSGLGAGVVIVNQYGDHPITQDFNGGISFYPLVRPLQVKPVEGVQSVPLLVTSDRTTAQRIDASGELQFDTATDPKGPFEIGAAFSRTVATTAAASPNPSPSPSPSPSPNASPSPSPSPAASPDAEQAEDAEENENANPPAEARMVIIGSSSFATDGLFEQQLNGDVFLNSINWLSQQDDQVLSIRPREVTNRRIVMSLWQQTSAFLLAVILLPLLGFGTAGLIWWKRR
jgi:ABC-type uncharacterized transport system involved in gliding motility auxiliary subunit